MIYTLSAADIQVLREVVKDYRTRADRVRSRPGAEMAWGEGEDHQAPEVYIALPQDTITAATVAGTPAAGDTPGSGLCDIYEIVNGVLVKSQHDVLVYNLSTSELSGSWLTVKRDKYGSWIAVTGNAAFRWGISQATAGWSNSLDVNVRTGLPGIADDDHIDAGTVSCVALSPVLQGTPGLICPVPSLVYPLGSASEITLGFKPLNESWRCSADGDWVSGASVDVTVDPEYLYPESAVTVSAKAPNIDGAGMAGVSGYIFPIWHSPNWQFVPLGCSGTTGTGSV